jgi:hypothetical protein
VGSVGKERKCELGFLLSVTREASCNSSFEVGLNFGNFFATMNYATQHL